LVLAPGSTAMVAMDRPVGKLAAFAAALAALLVGVQQAPARSSQCTPVRVVFYESSDWQRLAHGLAADSSACAQYYVTIPAAASNKTQMVPNRASVVDALGPNFHAAAEINYAAWQNWVTSTGNSWYAAGVAAREQMTAAGFDVAAGDTWAVNEFPSAVRTGTGSARQNVRDLVRGLYYGTGSEPTSKGLVFVVGVGQNSLSFPRYKASLESWFQDQNFWADMTSYVGGFFQETYGDVRNYAVAGVDPPTRAQLLNQFLQHPLDLVEAPGIPAAAAGAHNFLTTSYGPLANASWAWSSSYGWTNVGSDVMSDYVDAQTYAMRSTGEGQFGFAWNPLNSQGLATSDFNTQVAAVLQSLAGSIQATDGGDPTQACAATGCSAVVDGAATVNGWQTFSTWTPTVASFTSAAVSTPISTPSSAITLQLQTGGVNTTLPNPTPVTVTSSAPSTTFATNPSGPWSPTLSLFLPPGTGSTLIYVLDPTAGTPTLTATTAGQTTTQVETIVGPAAPPPPPPSVQVDTASFSQQSGRLHVGLQVVDQNDRPVTASVSFAVTRNSSPFFSTSAQTASDGTTAVTGSPMLRLGCYRVVLRSVAASGYVWNKLSPADSYCVTTLPSRVAAIVYGRKRKHLRVGVRITDESGDPIAARLSLVVRRGSTRYASASGRTNGNGWFYVTAGKKLAKGCYSTVVTSITAHGYAWDHVTGSNRTCVLTR